MSNKRIFRETDGVRGKANYAPLDTDTVMKLGKSLAEYVKKTVDTNPNRTYKVMIGKDTRRSGYLLEQTLTAGFLSRGVDVMLIGPTPTPSISHLVKSFNLDLGVMITASHNPYYDNGIKVFNNKGAKFTDKEEKEVEDIFFNTKFNGCEEIGRAKRIEDVSGRYIEFIKSTVDNISLRDFTIVVDCANGGAYKTAPMIFEELGAKVIPIAIEPNGYNINVDCGSLYPEKLSKVVQKEKADIGIALDGDADRVIMVDENGEIIDGDQITGLVAKFLNKKKLLNKSTVVVTQYSNLALDAHLKENGVKVEKVVNGDRAIADLCLKNGYNFGGEKTGHFIFFDHSITGDGSLTALWVLKIMIEEKKKLSELAHTFKKYPQKVFNVDVEKKTPLDELEELQDSVKKWEKHFGEKGRILLRYSGTENILRIMVEAESERDMEKAGKELTEIAVKLLVE